MPSDEVRDALEKLEQAMDDFRKELRWLALATLLSIGAVVGMVWRLG